MSIERENRILSVMFQVLSRVQANDRVPQDRDELMEWARNQLIAVGINVHPMGMEHAVIICDCSASQIDCMNVKEFQKVKDAIADVACWHFGFEAAKPDYKAPPQLQELIEFGSKLQQHINKMERN